jgi:hypothetical protein
MKRVLVAIAGVSALFSAQAANNTPDVQDLLILSKFSGVCGVMQQMVLFQQATKMLGGDEFIARFWRTEFARLGKSQEQFLKECELSIANYDKFYKLAEPVVK